MLWVVQSNLYKEVHFQELIRLLDKMQIPKILVKPLPFTLKLALADSDLNGQDLSLIEEPYIDNNQHIMVCGAYTMSKIAKDRGWTPGAFINENFEFNAWCEGWGRENLLNSKAITGTVENLQIPARWNKLFARPTEDTKSFAGNIFLKEDFENWLKTLKKMDHHSTINSETQIMIAPVQEIFCEYRLFIVDGKIITGSLYKLREQVTYSPFLDESVLSFAQKMIKQWQPDRAFVMDVAVTPEGEKIVEINNINSSGFYASDIAKFIMAIENMKFDIVQKKKLIN